MITFGPEITSYNETQTIQEGGASVHRRANNGDVAGGQLAVFQGASEAPISESYGSNERKNSQTGPDPEGCVENAPATRVARRFHIDSDMRPPRALPTAHFERNDVTIICETVH
jgi:hypothetical protein